MSVLAYKEFGNDQATITYNINGISRSLTLVNIGGNASTNYYIPVVVEQGKTNARKTWALFENEQIKKYVKYNPNYKRLEIKKQNCDFALEIIRTEIQLMIEPFLNNGDK